MDREELLNLRPQDVTRLLTLEEILHIAAVFGAYWHYNYDAAWAGRPGLHAITKSQKHTDEFLISRFLLTHENIRKIFAGQIVMLWQQSGLPKPDCVIGVPSGATDLAKDVAQIIGAEFIAMEKVGGRITLTTDISGKTVMLVEDFITEATGVSEAIRVITGQPGVKILEYIFAIVNRGALKYIEVENIGRFGILPIASKKINRWNPTPGNCPLCNIFGSKPTYPKRNDKDWSDLTTSQAP
jgi:orotate phosphoribosyltransferase